MTRVPLTTGGWFSADTATKFAEATRWDGHNRISRATGSQWDHEALFYTRTGRWVLNCWSQRDGSGDDYGEIVEADAVAWLIAQSASDDDLSPLPESVRQRVAEALEAAEVQ